MALYIIAPIQERTDILLPDGRRQLRQTIGYRIFDSNTMKYTDASVDSVVRALRNGTTIEGLTLKGQECELTYGRYDSYSNEYTLPAISREGKPVHRNDQWVAIGKNRIGVLAVNGQGKLKRVSWDIIKTDNWSEGRFSNIEISQSGVSFLSSIEDRDITFKNHINIEKINNKLAAIGAGQDYMVTPEGLLILNNQDITHIVVPDVCKEISESLFSECTKLESVKIGKGVKIIKYRAFRGCISLSRIEIPGNVKTIEEYAFTRCSNLKEVILHPGIERIGNAVFYKCENLNRLRIPPTIRQMKMSAVFRWRQNPIIVEVPFSIRHLIVDDNNMVKINYY